MEAFMARPTIYTDKLAEDICAKIAKGISLRTICKPKDMPDITTIYYWIKNIDGFSKQYAQAKDDQADSFAEDILQIADNTTPEEVQVAKLQIDSRKWLASKFKAKKYGDSTQIRHADADGNKLSVKNILDDIDGSTTGLPEA